tara:strand:- start:6527 stop:7651 length:1125 start_codon:yes stop_codon:yes gene_type:complete
VQLLPDEIDRISQLRWPAGDPLGGQIINIVHSGQIFLKHQDNGDCVFLNPDNGYCRIHEQFGESAKPVGCQLFPFSMHRTFGNKVSILPRHDCPSVRQNKGDRYKANQLGQLADIVLDDAQPFSDQQRCELSEDQIQALVDFLTTLLPSLPTPTHKAMFLYGFCDWLSHQEVSELNREALGNLYQPLVKHVEQWITDTDASKLRKVDRFGLANLLSQYLRRDEDVLDKRVGRLKRATCILFFGSGIASVNTLGTMYPANSGKSGKMFDTTHNDKLDFFALDQFIKTRIQTFGFMGEANHDLDLLDGLRSLCLLYPLVIATARLFTHTDNPMDIAIGAVDHAFGRSQVLRSTATNRLARQLLDPDTFARLMVKIV